MKRFSIDIITLVIAALVAFSCNGNIPGPEIINDTPEHQSDSTGDNNTGGGDENDGGNENGGGEEQLDSQGKVEPAAGSTIYGIVSCNGNGVAGVVVSDGVEVVKTDGYGIYQLPSKKKYRYVWISVPAGYEVPSRGVLPEFWQPLEGSSSAPERHDFILNKTGSDDYTLYVLGDMHLARRTNDLNQFRAFAADLNASIDATAGNQYILTLGDMTWDLYWYENGYGLADYLDEVNADFSGIQFWHTMGNHDNDMQKVGDFNKEQPYRDRLAPTFYSFNLGQYHMIVMDDIDYGTTGAGDGNRKFYTTDITQEQFDWLKKDLATVPKSTPIMLSTHAPVNKPVPGAAYSFKAGLTGGGIHTEEFLKAFSGYQLHIFTGHTHNICNYVNPYNGLYEHNSGAVCADWWWSGKESGVLVSQDGAPSGYTIVSVSGKKMTWRYKASGYPIDYQFRSYDMNEVKKVVQPSIAAGKPGFNTYVGEMAKYEENDVLLNIWYWDPQWKISVTENGTELDVLSVWEYDPLHIIAYTAPRYNKTDSPTFPTERWTHFFKVHTGSPTSTLQISVTDRYGNTYSETMRRPKAFSVDTYKAK